MNIEDLIASATQTMLQKGQLVPMISLELEQKTMMFPVDFLSDTQSIVEQGVLLACLGKGCSLTYPNQQILSAGFCSVAWELKIPITQEEAMRPVMSRNKQEVILIALMTTKQHQVITREIIRGSNQVLDVGPVVHTELKCWQLERFWFGAQNAQKPESVIPDLEPLTSKEIEIIGEMLGDILGDAP